MYHGPGLPTSQVYDGGYGVSSHRIAMEVNPGFLPWGAEKDPFLSNPLSCSLVFEPRMNTDSFKRHCLLSYVPRFDNSPPTLFWISFSDLVKRKPISVRSFVSRDQTSKTKRSVYVTWSRPVLKIVLQTPGMRGSGKSITQGKRKEVVLC